MKSHPPLILEPDTVIRKRVFQVQVELSRLLDLNEPDEAEIHVIRTHIKQLRSWLRLAPDFKHNNAMQQADHLLRDLARYYADKRDFYVQLALLNRFADKNTDNSLGTDCRRIREILPFTKTNPAETVHPNLSATLPDMNAITPMLPGPGLEHSYRQARRLSKRACKNQKNRALLHRLRKKIKYLDYQLLLTCTDSNKGYSSRHQPLKHLGKLLGKMHDMSELDAKLRSLSTGEAAASARHVRKLVRKKARKLQPALEPAIQHALGIKPRDFINNTRDRIHG